MRIVADILAQKGAAVQTVAARDPLPVLASDMHRHGIGCLIVVDDGHLVGLVSERDLVRAVATRGCNAVDFTAAEIMTRPVQVVGPQESIGRCMALMTERRIRHLPVLESGRLIGIVSIGDLVKARLEEQDLVIGELESYIQGAPGFGD